MTKKNNTILVADINVDSMEKLKADLIDDGFRVFTVESGRNVLTCMRRRVVDIAIIDVDLKDMEGYKIIPLMKDINRDVKVVITTKSNSTELESICRAAGIIYYAIKPIDNSQLIKVVLSAIVNNKRFEEFEVN